MASLQHTSILKSSLASLKLQDDKKLTWETVTSDLIEVWNQHKGSGPFQDDGSIQGHSRRSRSRNAHGAYVGKCAQRVKLEASKNIGVKIIKKEAAQVNAVSGIRLRRLMTILDSGSSDTFFKLRSEVEAGSYKKGSNETVTIASGTRPTKCIGSGTFKIGNLKLPGLHLENCNNTL
eukprot:IDg4070t1